MPTENWPTLSVKPSSQTWSLQANTQVHVSPLTGATQTQELPGAVWATTIEYANLGVSDASILQAFIAKLRGRAGRAFVRNWGVDRSRGLINGAPLVNGAAQTGASLVTDGWGTGGNVKAGDLVGVGGYLYMIVADATASVGAMTLTLSPNLRASPADNAALTFTRPTCTMMLVDDRQGWQYAPGGRRSFQLDLVEVI